MSARRARPPKSRRRSILWRWRRGLFVAGLLFIAGLAVVTYALVNIELPPEHFQAQTTFICSAEITAGCDQSNAIATLHGEQDRVDVALAQVPQVMIDAVLSAEDQDFFEHGGIDPLGVLRALWHDLRDDGPTQGGSTITQQYVKKAYLSDERTITRKIKEAVLAIKLEQELTKQQILERYLNIVYFGRGAYGVGAAVRIYFGHDLGQITLAEAAYLAGLIPSPETGDAFRDPEEGSRRRRGVLQAMLDNEKITAEQMAAADATPWTNAILPRVDRHGLGPVTGADIGAEYFVEYVRQQLREMGFSDEEIYGGGLRVYTTLDMERQRAAWDAVTTTLDDPANDPLAALVAIDPEGHIVSMIGGRDFAANKVNLAVSNGKGGGGSGRQPGSAFKPFVLAEALRQGISVQSYFNAPGQITLPRANSGSDWRVNNAEPSDGVLNLIDATQHSSNTVFAQLMVKVGPENVVPLAERMGITADLPEVNALVLGAGEVSPLDMASGYSTFAHRGVHITPTVITRVERSTGATVTFDQAREAVLTEQEADTVNYCLQRVVQGGTGTGANPGFAVAGKTGTTDEYRDAWFVGYAPNGFTTAVWMGYDVDAEGNTRYMTNVRGGRVYGGSFPATIWRKFMSAALDDVDTGSFIQPGGFGGRVINPELSTTSTASTETTTSSSTTTTASGGSTTGSTAPGETTTSVTIVPTTTLPPTTGPPPTDPAEPVSGGVDID